MLGEACPACGGATPLMRKRWGGAGVVANAGETYCVKCRAWVRYQEEGEGGEEGEEEESEEEEEEAVAARAPAAAAAAAPPAARRSYPTSSVSEAEDSALVDARQALVEALRDATLALRGQQENSNNENSSDSGSSSCRRASAARLVAECARALAAVRAALGSL